MPPSLLHASPATPTLLLDIPASLSAPPGLAPRCTTSPPAAPYALPEPKQQTPFTHTLAATHARLLPALAAALADLHSTYRGPYHRPRGGTDAAPPPGTELDFHATCIPLLQSLGQPDDDEEEIGITLAAPATTLSDISDIYGVPVTSAADAWTTLTLTHPHPPKVFHIPPRSSFLLSAFQASAPAFAAMGRFDFVLLDPPWPNRSAARSSAYETLSRFGVNELLQLPVGRALAPGALVAVWITNKPRYRAFTLEKLFPRWGVEVVGEWVWVKVTTAGEPVFGLEATMRKPYEVLVFGRKPGRAAGAARERKRAKVEQEQMVQIPPKTIVAVPDLHSRKPGVKELVEQYLPANYRACEIFGRNLTEGWFTWGDEAIKFNWDGHWKQAEAEAESEHENENDKMTDE